MFTYIYHSIGYLAKGGIVMMPIIFCSFLALTVFIERLLTLKREKVMPPDLFGQIKNLIMEDKADDAFKLCDSDSSSLAKIIKSGLNNHGKPRETVKEVIEEVGRREVAILDKYTGIIGTIANITPLLGLLGTVSGMIKAFDVISSVGVGDPAILAGGISEALITTASGLTVAIPAFVAYKFLLGKADSLVLEMEAYSIDLVELLKGEEEKPKKVSRPRSTIKAPVENQ